MKDFRILHMIDSLAAGGAERMAINMSNLLNERGVGTWLCATRASGPLKGAIACPERYICLQKQHFLDLQAFSRLVRLIRRERIQIIHAHSSSLAWAAWARKLTGVKVVWHDHYGNSEFLNRRNKVILGLLAKSASHVISVNEKLATWAVEALGVPAERVTYLPNFPLLQVQTNGVEKTSHEPPVIICLANLRPAKDHHTLVQALAILKEKGISFQTWLVGADYGDEYAQSLKQLVRSLGLENQVEFFGMRTDVGELLQHADIGVLSSRTEGLPVALLEYGMAGLPAVTTDVGQCRAVVGNSGLVVPAENHVALANALGKLLKDIQQREYYAVAFRERVARKYSGDAIFSNLVNIYSGVVDGA